MRNFTTSDLSLATALVSKGFQLLEITQLKQTKAEFSFQVSEKLNIAIESYWQRELLIEPRQFFDNLKMIKQRLYDTLK